MNAQLPATTKSRTPSSEQPLPAKLNELVLSGDSPVVGPETAAQLREFAARPEPVPPTEDQVETMIGKLSMATAQARISDAEANARQEMYWLALRDIPADDLRAAFVDLLRTCKFMPTPAEIRSAAVSKGALRRYAKSRARFIAWKHSQDWTPSTDLVPPEELRTLMARATGN